MNNGKLRMASGIIAGQKLNFVLRQLNLRSTGVNDFDDLPIPYRAIAADLKDGSMVVIDHGSVADAMRASMAIPGAFTPHEIDGRTLIDGGMVRNLPYDVVKSMGADVVIAVNVGTPVGELKDDPTFLGVVSRTLDLATKANVAVSRAQFTDKDLLMTPDLGPVTTASFALMGEAAQAGRSDRPREHRLAAPVLRLRGGIRRLARPPARRPRGPAIEVAKVNVVSTGRVDARRVAPRIMTGAGAPWTWRSSRTTSPASTAWASSSRSTTASNRRPPAPADVVITAREKVWGPNYLRFGLALADHFDGNASYNLLFYHRRAALNTLVPSGATSSPSATGSWSTPNSTSR